MRRIVQIIILSLALMLPAVVSAQTGVFKVKKETTTSKPKPVQKQESKPKVNQEAAKQKAQQREEERQRAIEQQREEQQLREMEQEREARRQRAIEQEREEQQQKELMQQREAQELEKKREVQRQKAETERKRRAEREQIERDNKEIEIKKYIQELENNMVYVEGGTFTIGATREQGSEAESAEKPAHKVTLASFYISKYEVTQALWEAIMGRNPSHYKGENLPVESVSWNDCQTFIRKLNQLSGKNFRLPSEAEWEYAARGGTFSKGKKYSGSNNIGDVAWYDGNSGGKPQQVGTKQPNELGLYDMSGNVYEWCQDCYAIYKDNAQLNPTGPTSGSNHVRRGGCWDCGAGSCRVSNRSALSSSFSASNLGFRLVM